MDTLTKTERSRRMASVRSKGNKSTERTFRLALVRRGIKKWTMHPSNILGSPDFFFPKRRLALFIDGCFWHGCQKCKRPMPQTHRAYWNNKLVSNVLRSRRVNRALRRNGFTVIRIWEHSVKRPRLLSSIIDKVFGEV